MIRELGFAILGDEAEVRALGVGGGELEISIVQADQHHGVARITAERRTGLGRVHGDRFAQGPFVVPPFGARGGGAEHEESRQANEQVNEAGGGERIHLRIKWI